MPNPFEDATVEYQVLRNGEHQFSLWPQSSVVPAGWDVVYQHQSRRDCLAYINTNWTDMRPRSLVVAVAPDIGSDFGR